MTCAKILFVFVVLFASAQRARSQFRWEPTMLDRDWRFSYDFRSLSCDGDNCISATIARDGVWGIYSNVFLRSTDGGVSWTAQEPPITDFPWWYGSNLARYQEVLQIDDLNAVAVGDSGHIARTFDGGLTWEKQDLPTTATLMCVHFSDPLTGIATAFSYDSTGGAYVTDDGGHHWKEVEFLKHRALLLDCRSFGNGKYRVFSYGFPDAVVTSTDNWATVKVDEIVIDSAMDASWASYRFARCKFGDGDTIVAYGSNQTTGQGAIARSTDGGQHWQKPMLVDLSPLETMTSIDHDTVIASTVGLSTNKILMSYDRGNTWHVDSLMARSGKKISYPREFANVKDGLLGIMAEVAGNVAVSYIEHGTTRKASVRGEELAANALRMRQNMESSELMISNAAPLETVCLLDVVGREVMEAVASYDGVARLDLRGVASGVYVVVCGHGPGRCVAGRVVVTK